MKTIYFIVGEECLHNPKPDEVHYCFPISDMFSKFSSSKYAHTIKMYAHDKNHKIIWNEINNKSFDEFRGKKRIMVVMITGSDVYITAIRKYLCRGKAWKNSPAVTPLLQFKKNPEGKTIPIHWYDKEFKEFFYAE